jgi:hypothetical protein
MPDIYENGELYGLNNQSGCEYSLNISTETNTTFSESAFCNFHYNHIHLYLIVLIIIGCIGNFLTIIIFSSSKFSHYKRTKFYLICLSISDLVYLSVLFFVWLDAEDFSNILNKNYVCQFSVYLTYISGFMSANLIIVFTTQRFFSIVFPFKKNIMEEHCKLVISGLIAFACIFYNYAIWGFNSEVII